MAHGVSLAQCASRTGGIGQNGWVRGGDMSIDTVVADDEVIEIGEVEELLVEEVSIDGLCGVY